MLTWQCINGRWTAFLNGSPVLTLLAGPYSAWAQPDSLNWALADFRRAYRAAHPA